jgi:hypothetical protein
MQPQSRVPALHISETRGNPVETFSKQTTPIGRVIQLRLSCGSFTWQRPVAVEVRQGDSLYRLPIHDTTLRLTAVIFLTGLATVLVPLVFRKILSRRRKTS